jgi:hypothetical protein
MRKKINNMITEEEELEIYDMGLDYASQYKGEGSHPNPEGYSERQIGMFHGFSDGYIKSRETYYTQLADIRNKLTPLLNLIQMIEHGYVTPSDKFKELVEKEIVNCKTVIEYLSTNQFEKIDNQENDNSKN